MHREFEHQNHRSSFEAENKKTAANIRNFFERGGKLDTRVLTYWDTFMYLADAMQPDVIEDRETEELKALKYFEKNFDTIEHMPYYRVAIRALYDKPGMGDYILQQCDDDAIEAYDMMVRQYNEELPKIQTDRDIKRLKKWQEDFIVFLGTCNKNITFPIDQAAMERDQAEDQKREAEIKRELDQWFENHDLDRHAIERWKELDGMLNIVPQEILDRRSQGEIFDYNITPEQRHRLQIAVGTSITSHNVSLSQYEAIIDFSYDYPENRAYCMSLSNAAKIQRYNNAVDEAGDCIDELKQLLEDKAKFSGKTLQRLDTIFDDDILDARLVGQILDHLVNLQRIRREIDDLLDN